MGKIYNTNSADMALVSSDDKLFFATWLELNQSGESLSLLNSLQPNADN